MLVKILGAGDLIAALLVLLSGILPKAWLILAAKWLIIKGGIFAFMGNMASFIDIFFGVYCLLLVVGFSWTFMNILLVIWLVQKGVLSLVRI